MVLAWFVFMTILGSANTAEPIYQREGHTMPDYRYVIDQVLEVVDGDTVELRLDMGFQIDYRIRVRLLGLDTPEKTGVQKPYGLAVKDWATRWYAAQKGSLYLISKEWDKYGGRVLGDIQLQDGTSLTAVLIKKGLGRPYKGDAKKPWTKAELDAALSAAQQAVDKP